MLGLRDRIEAIESALRNLDELDVGTPTPLARHSFDHRFDKTDPAVDAAPFPTPAQERANPFQSATSKSQHYDSIAATYGLGILDQENFDEYTVYDAFVTNLRLCPCTVCVLDSFSSYCRLSRELRDMINAQNVPCGSRIMFMSFQKR